MLQQKQIIKKKQYGDNTIVSQMLTRKTGKYISPGYVTQIFLRPGCALYNDAISALQKVIETREQLVEYSEN